MVTKIRQWVMPPATDEGEGISRVRTLLNITLGVFFISTIGYGFLIPVAPEFRVVRVVIIVTFLLLLLALKQLLDQSLLKMEATFTKAQHELNELKQTQGKLRESEERYRAVIENQTEFIVRWKPDGTRTFVNEAYSRYFGLTSEDAISTSFLPLIVAEDRSAMQARIARLLSGTLESETYVHQVVKPDGSVGWQEWTDQIIRDESGQVAEFQSVGRDVTERKLSEQALRESEQEFRTLVTYVPNAAIYLDSPNPAIGTYYISPQIKKMLGYSPEEWVANPTSWSECIYPEDRERILAADARHNRSGEPFSQDYRLMTRDGHIAWIRDQGAMVLDETGQPRFSLGIMIDITERKQAEADLQQYAKRMEILHEIDRSLLSARSPQEIAKGALSRIRQLLSCLRASVTLFDFEKNHAIFLAADFDEVQAIPDTQIPIEDYGLNVIDSLKQDKPWFTNDMVQESQITDVSRRLANEHGIRAWLSLPLLFQGQLIGALNLGRGIGQSFTTDDAGLVREVADQIAIVIQQNRLLEETQRQVREQKLAQEKLSQQAGQMSALYDIGLTITSNLEPDQILHSLFEKCQQLLPMDTFYIAVYDEEAQIIRHPLFYDGVEKRFVQVDDRNIETAPGLSGYVIRSRATLYLPNSDTPEVREKYQNIAVGTPSKSYVGAPMLFHETIVGVLSVQKFEANAYSPEQIRLLETIATQAAIAIENAHLYQSEQERRQEAETLRNSLTNVVTLFELEDIVERILDQIKLVIPYDTASVWRVDGEWLTLIVGRDLPPELPPDLKMHLDSDNSSRPLIHGEKPFLLNNNVQESRKDFQGPHSYVNSWLAVPLKKRGKIIGQIALDSRKREQFTSHHAELAVTFADQVAIALENASLYAEIQQELAEREHAENTLRQRDEILQAVAHAAQVFLQTPDWRESINNVLQGLGRATDTSHVYIFENYISAEGKRYTSQRYEWASGNAKPEIDNPIFQNVPLFGDGQKYWGEILGSGRTFVGNMAVLPKDEAEYFQERGIKSILDVPIFVSGAWWGVMGFDDYFNERTWSPAEIEALEIAAKMISAAIESEKANDAIRQREESHRNELEAQVLERTSQLTAANQLLQTEKIRIEQVVDEVATLRRLSDFLQASMTVDEACNIIASHMQSLFANTSGALYLITDGVADLTLVTNWGNTSLESVIQPNDCWGMRRGRVFVRQPLDASPACSHFGNLLSKESMCLPLLAQNETIGLLCMQVSGDIENYFTSDVQNLAVASADSIALALANLRLRDRLHNQSVRDPLTGLFNRRYLEETLARETHRASRSQSPLCVIMFEVDNFKVYNNTFGHDAGDYVLRKVADTMRANLRRSDFPCRYGGDEFTLLLPETSLEDGAHRADELRKSVEVLALSYNNQALGQVTVRMGVAAYPKHGETGEAVLKAADDASYRARAIGKNCVVVAD